MVNKYPSNTRLWRVCRDMDGYYFELKLAGTVIAWFDADPETVRLLRKEGVIKD